MAHPPHPPGTGTTPADQDQARLLSRHTLSYIILMISEMLNAYDLHTLDLLIIHAIMNTNVLTIMGDRDLDKAFASTAAIEPDSLKRGVSRTAVSRFLNMPNETVRRRTKYLVEQGILVQTDEGLIVTEANLFKFGNNPALQQSNFVLFRRLIKNLREAGFDLD